MAGKEGCHGRDYDAQFSLAIVLMLLISPLGWMYYFPLLILPFVVSWRLSAQCPMPGYCKAWIASAWLLSTVPRMLLASRYVNRPYISFTWAGYYFYSLLILWMLMLFMVHDRRRRTRRLEFNK